MNRIFSKCLLSIFFCYFLASQASAREVSTARIDVIKEQIDSLRSGDYLITDVKGVLFYSADEILSSLQKHEFKNFKKDLLRRTSEANIVRLDSIVRLNQHFEAVDPQLIKLMMEAQDRGVILLVLTSSFAGKYGVIEDKIKLRTKNMKKFGFEVKSNFVPKFHRFTKEEIGEFKIGKPAIFQDGKIFAHRNPKGPVIRAFMKFMDLSPERVLFIDNDSSNIDKVGDVMDELGVDYIGIHYTKAYEYFTGEPNEKRYKKQFEYLENKSFWLTDDMADCMLEHKDDLQFCLEQ